MPMAIPLIVGVVATSLVPAGFVAFGLSAAATAALIGGAASMAAGLLMPKASSPDISNGLTQPGGARTQQFRQPTASHEVVVGRVKKSGPIMFVYTAPDDAGRKDGYFYMVHALAAHHCLAIGDIFIDADLSTASKFSGLVRFTKALGSTSQAADSNFVAETNGAWTADHRLRGRAALFSRLKGNAVAFPNGVPNISAIVWGTDEITDPRTSTTGWTNNAILVIYWWMTWGEGYDPTDFDSATLIASANICDERVPVATATAAFIADPATDLCALAVGARSPDVGDGVRVSSSATLPAGLAANTTYYAIPSDDGKTKLATSVANAFAGTAIDITSAGAIASTGTGYTSDAAGYAVGSTNIGVITGTGTIVAGDYVSFSGSTNIYQIAAGVAAPGTITLAAPGLAVALPASATALTIVAAMHTLTWWDEARYKINGTWTTDAAKSDVRDQLLTACAGFAVEIGGMWFLHAGAAATPTVTLDEDDLRASMVTVPKRSMRDRFNGVRAVFINPDNNWQPSDAPPMLNAGYMAEDDGVELYEDIRLPFTTSARAAQRLMKIHLERNRKQRTVKFPAKLTAMRLKPIDGCYVTNARYGWVQEQMQVMGWVLAEDGGIDLQLQEDSADVYAWSAAEEQTVSTPQSVVLPDPTSVTAPTNLVVATPTTPTYSHLIASWTASSGLAVLYYNAEYRDAGTTDWTNYGEISASLALTVSVERATPQDFQITAVKGLSGAGEITATPLQNLAPAVPTSPSATGGTSKIDLAWTNGAGAAQVQIFMNTSNDFSSSTLLTTLTGTAYSHTGLSTGNHRWYWLRSINAGGNISTNTAEVDAVAT